jgi:hypothetical protein
VRSLSSLPAETAHSTTRYPVIKMCAWLGLSAYGSYDHRNSVEADRAQRRAKIIIPVRADYRASRAPTVCATTTISSSDAGCSSPPGLPPQAPPPWSRCWQQRSPYVPPHSPRRPDAARQ